MKAQRQAMIMEIIASRDIETQEQLLQALQSTGFHSTQATISRDIKDLHIVKELTKFGSYRYTSAGKEVGGSFSPRLNKVLRECVTDCDYAQNTVVIHTLAGLASDAASAVDAMKMRLVLGSVAGNDTVLIVMRDSNAAAAFCTEVEMLLK